MKVVVVVVIALLLPPSLHYHQVTQVWCMLAVVDIRTSTLLGCVQAEGLRPDVI